MAAATALLLASCSSVPAQTSSKVRLSNHDLKIAATVAHVEAAGTDPTHPGIVQATTETNWPKYVTGVQVIAGITRAAAEKFLDASSDDQTQVVLVRLTGHFAALHTGPPPATPSSPSNNVTAGSALEVIANASSGKVFDFSIGQASKMPEPQDAQTLFTR